jgi:diguanylate cyclase (GGDEF)-like protein
MMTELKSASPIDVHGPSLNDPGLDLPSKLLIVDDSPTIRATLRLALGSQSALITARDGEEAWQQLLADRGIELVLTDLDMPNLDGYGLLRRMRAIDNYRIRNTPVMVITGLEGTAAKEQAFEAGANDFIAKDIDHIELRARVRAHLQLARIIRQLEESRRILREQAYTDSLTGLVNRRAFFEQAERSLTSMQRRREDLSIVMIDIDHFKDVNDRFGHGAGDHVLKEMARVFLDNIRAEDLLARIGGEEFALVLPYTSQLAGGIMAERLRRAIKATEFDYLGRCISVTISQGLVSLDPGQDQGLEQLLVLADRRLYRAKQLGRDRVCSAESDAAGRVPVAVERPLRLGEALQIMSHGHGDRLAGRLPELLAAVLPLFECANRDHGAAFDLAALRRAIAGLRGIRSD